MWTVIALASLPDLRFGGRLYYSVTAFDYISRIPMASGLSEAISLPPPDPSFNPGYTVPLRYHYFWPMICGLVQAAGRGAFGVRDSMPALSLGPWLVSAAAYWRGMDRSFEASSAVWQGLHWQYKAPGPVTALFSLKKKNIHFTKYVESMSASNPGTFWKNWVCH